MDGYDDVCRCCDGTCFKSSTKWNNKPNLRRLVPKGIPYRSNLQFHSKWKHVASVQIAAFILKKIVIMLQVPQPVAL